MASREEYEELLKLKMKMKNALDIDDYDAARQIYAKFYAMYRKVTGHSLEHKLDKEQIKKIKSILNRKGPQTAEDKKVLDL